MTRPRSGCRPRGSGAPDGSATAAAAKRPYWREAPTRHGACWHVAVMGALHEWPASERPRERLLSVGPAGLSDAELLALVVGATSRGRGGVVSSCRSLLAQLGSVQRLSACTVSELMRVPGIGQARACALVAVAELARRLCTSADRGAALTSSQLVFARTGGRLAGLQQEVFVVLALDGRNRVIRETQIAQGSATAVEVHPREVFAPLIREAAAAGIVVHNHPSGDPEPSDEDLALTERLVGAAGIIGIPLLDHLVIGHQRYVSFADRGLL